MQQEIIKLDNGNYGLIVDHELYAEGNYEYVSGMMFTNSYYDGYDDEEENGYDEY